MGNTSMLVNAHYSLAKAKVSELIVSESKQRKWYIGILVVYGFVFALSVAASVGNVDDNIKIAIFLTVNFILGWNATSITSKLIDLNKVLKILKKMQGSSTFEEFTNHGLMLNNLNYYKVNEVI